MVKCPSCSAGNLETSKFCSECGAALLPTFEATDLHSGSLDSSVPSSGSDSSHHGRFLPGTKIAGRYRIVSLAGKGGMGEVYRADDLKIGHAVALKFLPAELAEDPKRLEFFHNEVRLSRQISHPNVCRVYDIGEVDGHHFLSMEYIDGEDLKILLRRIGRLPMDKGVQIAQQLCAGLAAAHDKGVLHRDLKPANIMLDGRGHVRITDFGLAKLAAEAAEGDITGTFAYMSPEQLAGGETSVQSDLYSLGLILYEIFTGRPVHESNSLAELRRRHEESTPTHPSQLVNDMDPAVERVILRCLQREPQLRPQSAAAVAAALPGGDPLAAALAAGETPSPEMIAAAGEAGGLSLTAGGGLLVAVCLLVAALPFFADWLDTFQLSRLREHEPAVLRKKSADLIDALGYDGRPADSVFGFELAGNHQLEFWYRQSSRPLDPNLPNLWLYAPAWEVTPTNPSPLESGMVGVRLDPEGRLLEFLAVPDSDVPGETAGADPAWDKIMDALGLNSSDFRPVAPRQTPSGGLPPVYADAVTVWSGKGTAAPESHVVMATRSGRLVYFRRSTRNADDGKTEILEAEAARDSGTALFVIVMVGFAWLLAMRNLRLDRTDTKGALRCALYYFLIDILLWAVVGHHVAAAGRESILGANYLVRSLAIAFRLWLYYVALEPFVRRLWPDVLISWSRLLSGRIRDPLVGRDLLIGCLFGVGWSVITMPIQNVAYTLWPNSIVGGKFAVAHVLTAHQIALISGIVSLAFLLLLRVVLRNTWLAAGAFTIFMTLILASGVDSPTAWIVNLVFGASLALLYVRFGLVSAISAIFAFGLLIGVPHTADFFAWYSDAGKFALAVVLIMAGYGFYCSTLAGRSPWDRVPAGP